MDGTDICIFWDENGKFYFPPPSKLDTLIDRIYNTVGSEVLATLIIGFIPVAIFILSAFILYFI